MKRKIIMLVLSVLMVVSIFPTTISAEYYQTFELTQAMVSAAATKGNTLVIDRHMVVLASITAPAGLTIIVNAPGSLTFKATFTVKGKLIGNYNLIGADIYLYSEVDGKIFYGPETVGDTAYWCDYCGGKYVYSCEHVNSYHYDNNYKQSWVPFGGMWYDNNYYYDYCNYYGYKYDDNFWWWFNNNGYFGNASNINNDKLTDYLALYLYYWNNSGYSGYGICNKHGYQNIDYCGVCHEFYCTKCDSSKHNHTYTGTTCSKHPTKTVSYCKDCGSYHCPLCGHYYINICSCSKCSCNTTYNCSGCSSCNCCNYTNTAQYCNIHKTYKALCDYCHQYYCIACNNNKYHYHDGLYYWNYPQYLPQCEPPAANVPNKTQVKIGDYIKLSTATPNAEIYYTIDGSTPTAYNGILYKTPIKITDKKVTIKAITVKLNMVASKVSEFSYSAVPNVSFNDISLYPGLEDSLAVLITAGIVKDGLKFSPDKGFTLKELSEWCAGIGIDFNKLKTINFSSYDWTKNLNYNDFVFIMYIVLREVDYIKQPAPYTKNPLLGLVYRSYIPETANYKSAYISFLQNGLFYGNDFRPDYEASRAYLAYALSAVIINNSLYK